jgi:hypothetical protein
MVATIRLHMPVDVVVETLIAKLKSILEGSASSR